jgi:hypothetical protein
MIGMAQVAISRGRKIFAVANRKPTSCERRLQHGRQAERANACIVDSRGKRPTIGGLFDE